MQYSFCWKALDAKSAMCAINAENHVGFIENEHNHFEFRRFKFCNIFHFVGKLWMRNPPSVQTMLKITLVSSKTDITISSFGGLSCAIFILLESSGCEIRYLNKQC